MKIQNLAAVAITTALAVAAVLMVAWQSREYLGEAPQTLAASFSGVDASSNREKSRTSPDTRLHDDDAGRPVLRTKYGLDISECKWGSERIFDEEMGADVWRCSLSSYWDFTTETLETMAYADAEAARVLAHRVRESDYPKAIQLALRSTALSGNSTPLIEARSWRPMVHRNGDPDLSGVGQAYVLMAVADKINSPARSRSKTYENVLRQSSTDPDATMQKLNEIVLRMIENMQQIELDVTGQVTIGENDDA